MVTKTLLETLFPSVIVENFDIVSTQHYPKEEEIHIHLDEKKSIPVEFSSRRVVFNGFTSAVSRNGRCVAPRTATRGSPPAITNYILSACGGISEPMSISPKL